MKALNRATRVLIPVPVFALFALAPAAAQCQWASKIVQSFMPHPVNPEIVGALAQLTPQSFTGIEAQDEKQLIAKTPELNDPQVQETMEIELAKLYAVGRSLYGTQVTPDVRLSNSLNINAFASGTVIHVNAGLLLYFLNPRQYWADMHAPQLASYTPWANDWGGVYAVLAHEAGHNLMRHPEGMMISAWDIKLRGYMSALQNQRKQIANGKTGEGIGAYFTSVLTNFLEQLQAPEEQQKRETEADLVSLKLLQGAGLNPAFAYQADQRLDLWTRLVGAAPRTNGQLASEALCSDHPGWERRMQDEATNLGCMRASGNLCQAHMPLAESNSISNLSAVAKEAEAYAAQTKALSTADGRASTEMVNAKIEAKPPDAQIELDGQPVHPGQVQMGLGRHLLSVTADGYRAESLTIVAFPDVHPNVQIKLKRIH